MSRIGKAPILIPQGVKISFDNNKLKIQGTKGSLEYSIPENIKLKMEDNYIKLSLNNDEEIYKPIYGTTRAIISNLIEGVTKGYERSLVIVGQGYRAKLEGSKLILQLGYALPIEYIPPQGIKITVPDPQKIIITGIDKEIVGNVAATIKAFKLPDHYKGQGVTYEGEYIRKKAGKKAAGAGAYGGTKA